MLNRLRRWLVGENSWPLLLLVLFLAFWLSPREWWASFTFFCVGMLYLALVVAHTVEFWKIQRKWPYILFAIAKLFFGVALLIGALIAAPQPLRDFTAWRMVARVLWFIGLPFWAVAVYLECWRIYRLRQAQR